MSGTFGKSVQLTVFGESHGPAIGCVIAGLPGGLAIDEENINKQLDRRKPKGKTGTQRREIDLPKIISGVYKGYTTGTPMTIVIQNGDTHSKDYEKMQGLLRPSHGDYTGMVKYHGYNDPRGGGHFSGRLTAPMVAAGAIFLQILEKKGIAVGTHISALGGEKDTDFQEYRKDIDKLGSASFPTLSENVGKAMEAEIQRVGALGDSIGGILETAVVGVEPGIGEPMFDSVESVLSALMFSIPGVKGVSFGDGFDFAVGTGSKKNDPFCLKNGEICTETNHNGGINGGISNGMPILFRTVVKPTPSIFLPQQTVNVKTGQEEQLQIQGRHDPAIIHRAAVVVDSMTALGLVDLYCQRYGYEWMRDKI